MSKTTFSVLVVACLLKKTIWAASEHSSISTPLLQNISWVSFLWCIGFNFCAHSQQGKKYKFQIALNVFSVTSNNVPKLHLKNETDLQLISLKTSRAFSLTVIMLRNCCGILLAHVESLQFPLTVKGEHQLD